MSAEAARTVVVELSAQGRAAVAVVLVDGPGAREAIRHFFSPMTEWKDGDPAVGRIVLGRWGGDGGEELIVCRRGEEQFEIHCHGGGAAVGAVVGRLESQGCRRMTWHEWVRTESKTQSSGLSSASRRDAATCAAQIALANAPTLRTAAVLLDQYHGALSDAVRAAREAVVAVDWARVGAIIEGVLRFRDVGLHLTSPWRVVLAGAPNVGKSSLINAIAGYQRAIVSATPGTTRDVVTVNTAIDGWPVELADTAGLRETRDELESAGVALADAAIREADLVLMVSDASASRKAIDETAVWLPPASRAIHVLNKIDLAQHGQPTHCEPKSEFQNPSMVSALTGEGIAELIAAIGSRLVPESPPAGSAVAFTREQIAHLEAARQAVIEQDAARADAELTALLAFD